MVPSAAACSRVRSRRARSSRATISARRTPSSPHPRLGQYLAAVRQLDGLARARYGKTGLALALRWLLDRGKVVALWGARRPEQLAPVSEVMGWSLDQAGMREIDRILAATSRTRSGPSSWPRRRRIPASGRRARSGGRWHEGRFSGSGTWAAASRQTCSGPSTTSPSTTAPREGAGAGRAGGTRRRPGGGRLPQRCRDHHAGGRRRRRGRRLRRGRPAREPAPGGDPRLDEHHQRSSIGAACRGARQCGPALRRSASDGATRRPRPSCSLWPLVFPRQSPPANRCSRRSASGRSTSATSRRLPIS